MDRVHERTLKQSFLIHPCWHHRGDTLWVRIEHCLLPNPLTWAVHREPRFARSCIVCTSVAESGITIPNVGLVISSGVQRRVSTDVRTGATLNALQTLSKAQLLQQLGRAGRMDCGVHITMMSKDQYVSQVKSSDLAQLEESDISPMILRSLMAGRSFSRLPFLCPPHPLVQTHAKERMFLQCDMVYWTQRE